MACSDYEILSIECRQLDRVPKNTKYHHVPSSHDLPQPSVIPDVNNPHETDHSGEIGTTSAGGSDRGIGHSIGNLNDEDVREPKHALPSSLSSSAGAAQFVTASKGRFPPPPPAGN